MVVDPVEAVAAPVGSHCSRAGEWEVLRGRHRRRHIVRSREVLLRVRARAGGVFARVVVVVGVGLILVLLLCTTKSA
jgi:hypothetical protein